MFNILIAYDNLDIEIGAYLEGCFSNLYMDLALMKDCNLVALNGKECTENLIEFHTDSYSGKEFIFIGFTHGRNDALTASHSPFISFSNATKFRNSFFYTCACSTAVDLGPELERNGCKAYIGYNTAVTAIIRFAPYFQTCKISGIKFFLTGNKSVKETYEHMLSTYDYQSEQLSNATEDSFIAAAILRKNMKSLVCLGNDLLTLDDFGLS